MQYLVRMYLLTRYNTYTSCTAKCSWPVLHLVVLLLYYNAYVYPVTLLILCVITWLKVIKTQ